MALESVIDFTFIFKDLVIYEINVFGYTFHIFVFMNFFMILKIFIDEPHKSRDFRSHSMLSVELVTRHSTIHHSFEQGHIKTIVLR